jgi:hypothetical protein
MSKLVSPAGTSASSAKHGTSHSEVKNNATADVSKSTPKKSHAVASTSVGPAEQEKSASSTATSEEEKRRLRAARFGLPTGEGAKIEKRKEKFGESPSTPSKPECLA